MLHAKMHFRAQINRQKEREEGEREGETSEANFVLSNASTDSPMCVRTCVCVCVRVWHGHDSVCFCFISVRTCSVLPVYLCAFFLTPCNLSTNCCPKKHAILFTSIQLCMHSTAHTSLNELKSSADMLPLINER